jgi:hypothetical protein
VVLRLQALSAAAAAQTVGLLSNRTAGTTPVPVLGMCRNENRMH